MHRKCIYLLHSFLPCSVATTGMIRNIKVVVQIFILVTSNVTSGDVLIREKNDSVMSKTQGQLVPIVSPLAAILEKAPKATRGQYGERDCHQSLNPWFHFDSPLYYAVRFHIYTAVYLLTMFIGLPLPADSVLLEL